MYNRISINDEKAFRSFGEESFPRYSFSDDDENEIVADLKKLQAKENKNALQNIETFLHHKITNFRSFFRPISNKSGKVERIAQMIAPLKNDHFTTKRIVKICNYIERHKKKWMKELDQGQTTSLYIRHNKRLPCTLSVESTGEVFLILKSLIGMGAFKKVKYAISYDTQELIANAVTPLVDKNFIDSAKTEAKIGKRLKGLPHIVPYLFTEIYMSKSGTPKQRILQVYFNGGSLWENLAGDVVFTPPQIKKIMRDILLGVQEIHEHHYLHRDLKLENIFLQIQSSPNGEKVYHASIGDFGLGSKLSKINSIAGTLMYIAPEVLALRKPSKEGNHSNISYAADLYSVGVLFEHFLDVAWINAGLPEKYPKFDKLPGDIYYLPKKLQSKKPEHRGTIKEALELVEKIDWDPFLLPKELKDFHFPLI